MGDTYSSLVEYMGRGIVYIVFALLGFGNNFFSGLAAWVLLACGAASIFFHSKVPALNESTERLMHDPSDMEGGKEYTQ